MLARVRDRFSIELPLRSIFESPTLQDFAAAISSAGTSAPTRRIARAPRGNTAPLSLAQQRLWFVDQLGPGNAAYNVPQRLHLSGNLDVPALQLALDQLVERHETLRTGIITDGQPHQVITDNLRLPLVLHDLRGLNPAERDGAAALLGAQEAATPFDLSQAPLMRASLIQLATHDYHLVLVLHHIISDRWSFNVLAQDLSALYAANLNAAAIALPPLEIQYADFASWQRQYLEEDVLKQQLEYWKERLEGAPALLELPLDHPRPAVETFLGASHIAALPSELAERLTEICREEDATLFMGLMAAFKVLLARHSGQSDLVVGTPIANRSLTELEPLIGFFVNTLAMRTDLSGDPDFREVVRRVKETALGAYAHEQVPFERIVEELKPERSLSHNPIFQVMFTIQEAQMSVMDLPGVEVSSAPLWNETATTDMSWFANVGAEGLRVRVEYARDLFDPVTVDRMIRRFQQLLEAIIADPATRISELPIVLPEERKLLTEWNDTAADVAYDRCAHDLFQEQVERTPDNLAVKYRDQQLSYRELNERANQLAHRLQKLGVGPEVPVAVCVGPSVELVIGIIAVTKAGGSFIPIDPANPTERIGFMLDDACVPVLLTQTSLLSKLPPHSGITILLDSAQAELAHESADNLISGATPAVHSRLDWQTQGCGGAAPQSRQPHRVASPRIQPPTATSRCADGGLFVRPHRV